MVEALLLLLLFLVLMLLLLIDDRHHMTRGGDTYVGRFKLDEAEDVAADLGFFKIASTDAAAATGPANATSATAASRERDVVLESTLYYQDAYS
jgi:hypothetical protein